MKRSVLFFVMGIVLLVSCDTQQKEEKTTSNPDSVAAKVAESISTNVSFLNDYNALEKLYANENWLIPGKKDSSYFYFSRLGNYQVNTYEYKLVKGDSAQVKHGAIQTEGDKLVWNFNGQKLHLTSASLARATWAVPGSDSASYEFLKLNDNELRLTYPDKKTVVMKKLLPFSLFLVRSQYDFAHGTKLAYDTKSVNQKKM